MRQRLLLVGVVVLAIAQHGAGQSQVVYTLELGGDNHADLYEAYQYPTFTSGVTSGTLLVETPGSLTWAVRVSVGGRHVGPIGDNAYPLGAANLVFDLELYDSSGILVDMGAAPLVAQGNQNRPAGAGFWSSINDGDAAGIRGAIHPDIEANGAFAVSVHNQEAAPPQLYRLIDPAPGGPNFDYGWYPTAQGRGGIDIDATRAVDHSISNPGLAGRLVGFGAGMKSYHYGWYRPGVGKRYFSPQVDEYGFGAFVDDLEPALADPLNPPPGVREKALFEGQISTLGLPMGTYTLKVRPTPGATNVIHGAVTWNGEVPDYGGFGSFAVPANEVYPTPENNPGVQFEVVFCFCNFIRGRHVFYNQSYYDNFNAAIQPPGPGPRDDDGDAIDPSKTPLMPGGGQARFSNWISYEKGINGLIYDVAYPVRPPVPGDFTFEEIGKSGVALPIVKVPNAFAVFDMDGGIKRAVVTFPNGSIKNTWLRVTIGTGFGLPAPDVHYWGHALGDSGGGNNVPYIQVTSTDEVAARNHRVVLPGRVTVDNPYDYNKDGNVTATDEVLCRNNIIPIPMQSVRMITR